MHEAGAIESLLLTLLSAVHACTLAFFHAANDTAGRVHCADPFAFQLQAMAAFLCSGGRHHNTVLPIYFATGSLRLHACARAWHAHGSSNSCSRAAVRQMYTAGHEVLVRTRAPVPATRTRGHRVAMRTQVWSTGVRG